MPQKPLDPVELAQNLIRCPSVTPEEGGALVLIESLLKSMGFRCHRLVFEEVGTPTVDNLYARFGTNGPVFGYGGHTDVVPLGDAAAWTLDPFAAQISEGQVWGRGASDMKGSVAAFVAATQQFLDKHGPDFGGSIALVITGDEEGPAINGTVKILEWMQANGEIMDACVVGEPTNPERLGDMIKIGRRGSLNGWLTVEGAQGHVAYPHLADNPLPRLLRLTDALVNTHLDDGSAYFPASHLNITDIHTGNPATNLTPMSGTVRFNIRFNDLHSGESLTRDIYEILDAANAGPYKLTINVSGESFLTPPGPLSKLVSNAVEKVTGRVPVHSTTGGTSDARFIKNMCPVVECGLVSSTIHKVNEHAAVDDIQQLTRIYHEILDGYFATG